MIKNIIFDLGNVLFFLDFSSTMLCLEKYLLPGSRPQDIFHEVIRGHEFVLFNKGCISRKQFFQYVRQFLDRTITEDTFWRSYSDIFVPNKRLMKAVEELKNSFDLYLLSNTDVAHMDYLFEKYSAFFDNFDSAVYSYEVGAMKPDREIFDILCQKKGIQPQSSLFIDDLEPNILTAQSMGFHVFHFQNNTEELLKYINKRSLCTGKRL